MQRAFDALDGAGISWCSLHGGEDLWHPTHDVDLLVAAEDRPSLEAALVSAGFMPVVSFSSGAHVFFAGYEQAETVLIDAVTELSFGTQGSPVVNWLRPRFETRAATSCLERRVRQDEGGGAWVLHPEDEFWVVLLNCVVDKGRVDDRHARRLLELLPSAHTVCPLARAVEEACPPGWDAQRVLDAVESRGWGRLVELGPLLARRSTRRRPFANRARWFSTGMKRLLLNIRRRLRTGLGLSVALLGPDGSGKSTLCSRIPEVAPMPCRVVYMGLWKNQPRGRLHQAGQILFRPLRMWAAYLTGLVWRLRGALVIFDRYAYDALLPPSPPFVWAKKLYFSVLAAMCPRARLALLLDAPVEALSSRRPEEYEFDGVELARSRYLSLISRVPRLEVVDAGRSAEAVLADVLDRAWSAQMAAFSGGLAPGRR